MALGCCSSDRLWQIVDHWAERRPEAEALVAGGERLSWGRFRDWVDAIAKAYLEIGVPAGGCVAMLSSARNEFLPAFFAAGKVGAKWVGLSPKFTRDEIAQIASDCSPEVILALGEYQGRDLDGAVRDVAAQTRSVRKVLALDGAVKGADSFREFVFRSRPLCEGELARRAACVRPETPALLMYTSGSTGRPKGVVHTHASVLASASVEAAVLGLDEDTRMLVHFPINHVASVVEIGVSALYAGGTVFHMPHFDAAASLELIEREGITVMGQVPTMYLMQMACPRFSTTDFSRVRRFVWSGANASDLLAAALLECAGGDVGRLTAAYGSTEGGGLIAYTRPGDDVETLTRTAGVAAPGYQLRVVGEGGEDAARGEVGEVWLRGPMLFKEYLNMPELTAARFAEGGWYRTEDLGWLDERGYVRLVGRRSEMFKTGGENVYPREVEEVLERHPAVAAAAVIGVPDPLYGEAGRAFVALRPGMALDGEALRVHCSRHLANYKVPKRFVVRDAFPMLPTAKIDKNALRRLEDLETVG